MRPALVSPGVRGPAGRVPGLLQLARGAATPFPGVTGLWGQRKPRVPLGGGGSSEERGGLPRQDPEAHWHRYSPERLSTGHQPSRPPGGGSSHHRPILQMQKLRQKAICPGLPGDQEIQPGLQPHGRHQSLCPQLPALNYGNETRDPDSASSVNPTSPALSRLSSGDPRDKAVGRPSLKGRGHGDTEVKQCV